MSNSKHTVDKPTELGEFDPDTAAELLGMTEQQKRFGMHILRGASQAKAAAHAGYSASDDKGLRAIGSRVANADRVKRFVAWGRGMGAGPSDDPATLLELKRILSRHARSSNQAVSVKATEALIRLNTVDEEKAAAAAPFEPEKLITRMCGIAGPILGACVARFYGLDDWRPPQEAADDADFITDLIRNLVDQRFAQLTGNSVPASTVQQSNTPAQHRNGSHTAEVERAFRSVQPVTPKPDALVHSCTEAEGAVAPVSRIGTGATASNHLLDAPRTKVMRLT